LRAAFLLENLATQFSKKRKQEVCPLFVSICKIYDKLYCMYRQTVVLNKIFGKNANVFKLYLPVCRTEVPIFEKKFSVTRSKEF
jgi:hypothetical protein